MEPLIITAAIIGVAMLITCITALLSRANDEPIERRNRLRTRQAVDAIATGYRAGAFTRLQAAYRLREIEAPHDAIERVLA